MLAYKHNPEIEELLYNCMRSTKVFAKTFFPEEVEQDFSLLHNKVFEVIDSKKMKKAIAAPRGIGKTTIAKIRVCKAIVFRETKFIIYLSNSASSAEACTEHIKRMLQANELIKKFFGEITFSKQGYKESFSKQSWVAYGDVFVLPRGAGQQVRGQNWMGNRPGLIVIDDLENTELVKSDEQRLKLNNWFYSDLMKTESKYGKKAEFLYIDTIKHEDALLQKLIDSSDWQNVDFPDGVLSICDENFNTYDSNYMTTEEIKEEYEIHRASGDTDLFYMEYMNIPISLEDAVFKEEYYKYYTEEGDHLECCSKLNEIIKENKIERVLQKDLITVVIVDPAKTVKLQSAESGVVVVSVSRKDRKIFVRNPWGGKVKPDDLYEVIFTNVLMYNAKILAVEETGLNEFIRQPLQNQMKVRGIYPTYISLQAKGDKDMRISTLAPNYKLGYMYHNKDNCQNLENQLNWHPKSKRKDIMDALSYINKIMDDHAMYFDPDDLDNDFEDEFAELLDDDLEMENWRLV